MTVFRVAPRLPPTARTAAGLCLLAAALAISAPSAQARDGWRYVPRHYRHAAPAASTDGNFSAIVVDANTGREIYGVNENGPRHPASITKVMTLYLLFEQLDKGALKLDSMIPISQHAAAQEPSKLGIEAGAEISVEDAIKAVVTRSANDVAVAIAEAIGHDEDNFAAMMTRKAHALGMSRTIYRNASGLPNDEQITTARDLTVLARATEERFPKYFKYFSTHEFDYDGEVIGNHNHLLGRVAGVDGIKTGYTRASGFNLLTSVHRDGRSLVAVVMGGRSAGARDRMMEQLIADHIAEASTSGHGATMIADNEPPSDAPVRVAAPRPAAVASARPAPTHHDVEQDGQGDDSSDDEDDPAPREIAPKRPARVATVSAPSPEALGWVKGPEGIEIDKNRGARSLVDKARSAKIAATAVPRRDAEPEETRVARSEAGRGDDRGDWAIQIGASDNAAKASELLSRARARSPGVLGSAKAVTEKVQKGEGVFYRARFAGLDSASAEQACRALKRGGFPCFTAHD